MVQVHYYSSRLVIRIMINTTNRSIFDYVNGHDTEQIYTYICMVLHSNAILVVQLTKLKKITQLINSKNQPSGSKDFHINGNVVKTTRQNKTQGLFQRF